MRSSNAVIKKCVVQRFGVRTPEWTQVVPKSSQDDPKMVPSLQKMTPRLLPWPNFCLPSSSANDERPVFGVFLAPSWSKMTPMTQLWVKLEPIWGQLGANWRQHWPKVVQKGSPDRSKIVNKCLKTVLSFYMIFWLFICRFLIVCLIKHQRIFVYVLDKC